MESSDALFEEMFQARGRRAAPDTIAFSREVNEADLDALAAPRGIAPLPITRIRSQHHMLAKILAEGRSPGEAQLMTGYSLPRISVLQADPTFQELVEYYRAQARDVFVDVQQRLASLGISSIEELQDRLEQAPEEFRTKELMELAAMTLDRAGFGPKSTVNHNVRGVVMTDETLRRIKAEAEARRAGVVREVSDGGGVIDSFSELGGAGAVQKAIEGAGPEGARPGLREEVLSLSEEGSA